MQPENEDILNPVSDPGERSSSRRNGDRAASDGSGIPDIVIRRLPIYARSLQYLAQEGIDTVSSGELGARLGVSAAQIRRDLSYFGGFGKQGKGYDVEYLLSQIGTILGLNRTWPMALVGVGYLGRALLHYESLAEAGFSFAALFDHHPAKIGQTVGGLLVHGMDELKSVLKEEGIEMAVMAVPASSAQDAADTLVSAGIRAILNYAPIIVKVPPQVRIRHIDPVVALQGMTYYLTGLHHSGESGANSTKAGERIRLGRLD